MITANNSTTEFHHHVPHHYESADAEYSASKLGVWIFLCTEILMFGGMFVAFAIYHAMYPEIFREGSKFCNWRFGATNTCVLIFSSLTMALSIYFAQIGQKKKVLISLYTTFICGIIFMCIKYVEWSEHIREGLLPGHMFTYHEPGHAFHNFGMFFSFYFIMTGIHGVHVLVGMSLIAWLIRRAHKGHFGKEYYTPLECVGLFWHLVDIVWIYLFPLLYLIR